MIPVSRNIYTHTHTHTKTHTTHSSLRLSLPPSLPLSHSLPPSLPPSLSLVLDISKHIDLYESALGLLYSLTSHSSLHPLLTIPIFPTGQQPSSTESGLTLFSLSKKLMTTATSYINTAKYGPFSSGTPSWKSLSLPPSLPPSYID